MEDRTPCERIAIKSSILSLKKYGSTNTSNKRLSNNVNYVKHNVQDTDTLQGISLKYGVTMEEIRRANRLWASDSLFLRKDLTIPITSNHPVDNKDIGSSSNSEPDINTSSDYTTAEEPSVFLSKIDASIANSKRDFRKTQHNSRYSVDVGDLFRGAEHMRSNNNNPFINDSDGQSTSMVPSNSKLKVSVQRLQSQQDELFEL